MEIKKVLNDGKHITQCDTAITFLGRKGYITPEYIWCGVSNHGIEICDITKKGCMAAIDRDNRLFSDDGKLRFSAGAEERN